MECNFPIYFIRFCGELWHTKRHFLNGNFFGANRSSCYCLVDYLGLNLGDNLWDHNSGDLGAFLRNIQKIKANKPQTLGLAVSIRQNESAQTMIRNFVGDKYLPR
jgi:hypothetical protein